MKKIRWGARVTGNRCKSLNEPFALLNKNLLQSHAQLQSQPIYQDNSQTSTFQ